MKHIYRISAILLASLFMMSTIVALPNYTETKEDSDGVIWSTTYFRPYANEDPSLFTTATNNSLKSSLEEKYNISITQSQGDEKDLARLLNAISLAYSALSYDEVLVLKSLTNIKFELGTCSYGGLTSTSYRYSGSSITFYKTTINLDQAYNTTSNYKCTIAHELAHALHGVLEAYHSFYLEGASSNTLKSNFEAVAPYIGYADWFYNGPYTDSFVSGYALTSFEEDVAETYGIYLNQVAGGVDFTPVWTADTSYKRDLLKNYFTELSSDIIQKLNLTASSTKVESTTQTTTSSTTSTSVIAKPSETDLSAYSSMNMDVYPNSRVTSIEGTSSGFIVKGYMFERAQNCNKYNSIWREIVLVNVDDMSSSSAYRKQVTPIYNTWLNKNMTATVNGQYNLDYANYEVLVNVNDMNHFVGNVSGAKVQPGTYYMYMRISNGKTSYLFPLCDVTLSTGLNMENTGTLPAGFTVYDQETRALTFTVYDDTTPKYSWE